jgi:hypothetical protein
MYAPKAVMPVMFRPCRISQSKTGLERSGNLFQTH